MKKGPNLSIRPGGGNGISAPLFISNTTTAHSLIRAVACGDIQFWCKYSLPTACKPLILLTFSKSCNSTPTRECKSGHNPPSEGCVRIFHFDFEYIVRCKGEIVLALVFFYFNSIIEIGNI